MSRSYHLCLDLRGALHNWSDREMKGVFKHDDGRVMTIREAKDALMDEIAKGRKVIPCSPCDNFDYQRGCQGHDGEAPQTTPEVSQAAAGRNEKGNHGNEMKTLTAVGIRAVSRGEALRNMEVRPVNPECGNQSTKERSDHASVAEHRGGGKPMTVKHGDFNQDAYRSHQNGEKLMTKPLARDPRLRDPRLDPKPGERLTPERLREIANRYLSACCPAPNACGHCVAEANELRSHAAWLETRRKMEALGLTEQDIAETMPPKPPEAR